MNPYDVDYNKFPVSPVISDKSELLKLKLIAKILEYTEDMNKEEAATSLGIELDKYKWMLVGRIDVINLSECIECLSKLGYEIEVSPIEKKAR